MTLCEALDALHLDDDTPTKVLNDVKRLGSSTLFHGDGYGLPNHTKETCDAMIGKLNCLMTRATTLRDVELIIYIQRFIDQYTTLKQYVP